MFKFLLKRRTGLEEFFSFWFLFFLCIASNTLCFYFFYTYIFEHIIEYIFYAVFFQIALFLITEKIIKLVRLYRLNTPYNIYTITEENKEIEVREYPIYSMKEYYYNGKIHRESGLAVEFNSSYICNKHGSGFIHLRNSQKGFLFLNGKKQTYKEFVNNIDKIKLQNKALSF